MSSESNVVEQIRAVYELRGQESYGVEEVTQLEHALQSAHWAEKSGAAPELIAAALLHDIGHILHSQAMPQECSTNLDDRHEYRAFEWLREHFGLAVADPVRLHVAAKRYLCSVDPDYVHQLTPTSLKSFHDQGGIMSDEELAQFQAEPHFEAAIQVRRWDDLAKDSQAIPPDLKHYLPYLHHVCASGGNRQHDRRSP